MKQFKFKRIISLGKKISDQNYVVIENGKIKSIKCYKEPNIPCTDLSKYTAVPGFIDLHIHGANGYDVMDNEGNSLEEISKFLVTQGVTSFLATTVTSTKQKTKNILNKISQEIKLGLTGAECLGIYLEGPFLSKKRKGAHPEKLLMAPNIEYMDSLLDDSNGLIKVIALAPELPGSYDFIDYFKDKGIEIAMAHSDATYEESEMAINHGAKIATHLCNGMAPMHHREGGLLLKSLLDPRVYAELIVDGEHVSSPYVDMIYQLKKEKLCMISDSMRAAGMPDGEYKLGELEVLVHNGIAKIDSGSLAGSTLTLAKAFKNINEISKDSLENHLAMFSLNPAKAIGLEKELGSIDIAKKANITVINEEREIVATVVHGDLKYMREGE